MGVGVEDVAEKLGRILACIINLELLIKEIDLAPGGGQVISF